MDMYKYCMLNYDVMTILFVARALVLHWQISGSYTTGYTLY